MAIDIIYPWFTLLLSQVLLSTSVIGWSKGRGLMGRPRIFRGYGNTYGLTPLKIRKSPFSMGKSTIITINGHFK